MCARSDCPASLLKAVASASDPAHQCNAWICTVPARILHSCRHCIAFCCPISWGAGGSAHVLPATIIFVGPFLHQSSIPQLTFSQLDAVHYINYVPPLGFLSGPQPRALPHLRHSSRVRAYLAGTGLGSFTLHPEHTEQLDLMSKKGDGSDPTANDAALVASPLAPSADARRCPRLIQLSRIQAAALAAWDSGVRRRRRNDHEDTGSMPLCIRSAISGSDAAPVSLLLSCR